MSISPNLKFLSIDTIHGPRLLPMSCLEAFGLEIFRQTFVSHNLTVSVLNG
jgi:hypothetical protein